MIKETGKFVTTVLLVAIFLLGVIIIFTKPDAMTVYLSLVGVTLVPMLVIMGGVAGTSIAKIIKGECKIEDVKEEVK